jgi:cellulose synthase (UDP-forming)
VGVKSPFSITETHSVVAIHLRDASVFESFMSTFISVQQASDISGSVAVLHGAQFQSFRIGAQVYHVGVLPWWERLRLWMMPYPWLVALVAIGLAFLLAVWMRQWLRGKARARLRGEEDR